MKNFPRIKSSQQIIHPPPSTQKKYVYCLVADKAMGKFHNLKTFPQEMYLVILSLNTELLGLSIILKKKAISKF